jgi:hypothetical protein
MNFNSVLPSLSYYFPTFAHLVVYKEQILTVSSKTLNFKFHNFMVFLLFVKYSLINLGN